MLQRTNKIFIGKDIDRTAAVAAATSMATVIANIVEGEVVVLDKFKKPLFAGQTIADSESIFICQGTGDTFSYTNEAGTTTTGVRKLRMSDEIQGANVRNYNGASFDSKSEQVDSWVLTGITPIVGTEYFIRIVYKDMNEHPGQFTQTYRVSATTAVLDTLGAALAAKVNAHSGRRVVAAYTAGTDTLTLTGLPIPECTTGLTDLDKFSMVEFESFLNYVDADGYWADMGATLTRTVADFGTGTWELMRDEESDSWGYLGITNRTKYPVKLPTAQVVKDATYNQVVIEHDVEYLSPDNQYRKLAPCTTKLGFVVGALQAVDVLAQLNPWMASCPGNFTAIAF